MRMIGSASMKEIVDSYMCPSYFFCPIGTDRYSEERRREIYKHCLEESSKRIDSVSVSNLEG